ncbi:hypothetical protein [Fusobacterium ulcerans]
MAIKDRCKSKHKGIQGKSNTVNKINRIHINIIFLLFGKYGIYKGQGKQNISKRGI